MERAVEFNPVLLVAEPTLVGAGAEPLEAGLWHNTQCRIGDQKKKKPFPKVLVEGAAPPAACCNGAVLPLTRFVF